MSSSVCFDAKDKKSGHILKAARFDDYFGRGRHGYYLSYLPSGSLLNKKEFSMRYKEVLGVE